ncbi:MAG: 2-C-methyl-D-erythritol 4-phosphate cytidylyltransferase [Deltaproteobacteria bacterium]|nr:2-C-methyl-D-erythritol 4-phosphate cytidylyltransferase [Deltaproteobacteria bacterium]
MGMTQPKGAPPKQFLLLEGKPILHWTLEALSQVSAIDAICLVVAADRLATTEQELGEGVRVNHPWVNHPWVNHPWGKKLQWIVAGGQERQDSVIKGLRAIPPCEIVLVHDAVRPFVTPKMVEALITVAKENGAALLALPVQETLKEVSERREVIRTVDRDRLWSVQTPQAFRYDLLSQAIARAERDSFLGTDEAMLVERNGHPVSVVEGSPFNIKITRPEDLLLAEGIVYARRHRL